MVQLPANQKKGTLPFWVAARSVLAAWPAERPLLYIGGKGSARQQLALVAEPMAWEDLQARPLVTDASSHDIFALIPYWDTHRAAHPAEPCLWRVTSSLVFHQREKILEVKGQISPSLVDWLRTLAAVEAAPDSEDEVTALPGCPLQADAGDDHYLTQVAQVRQDIRRGRFYQVNLLRYFSLPQAPTPAWLAARLTRAGGPFSAWLRTPDQEIVSFSPERFVEVDAGGQVDTYPIKGTCSRQGDALADARAAASLMASPKDRAELAMIVDLMRHDLGGVCLPHSVRVVSGGHLRSSATVHHLEGHVRGQLRPGLSWGDFLRVMLPAGSITGAPKVEVMAAISAWEKQQRGFFMGNLFYWDAAARQLSSSVLIRTLWRRGASWHYAAGGGLVLASDPERELEEIAVKCRIITDVL